jgi:hypothetical protein
MELEDKSPLAVAVEDVNVDTNIDKSTNIDALTDCQNEMEGTVVMRY